MYYLNCFIIYSIIGYIIESIYGLIVLKKGGSGILYGPWTPIYGFGSIITIFISSIFFKMFNLPKFLEIIIFAILIMIILTVMEYISGILIEKTFHVTFWNYKNFKFHIGKYICLEISLIWGILSLVLIYLVKPIIDKFINVIPTWITILLFLMLIIDWLIVNIKKRVHR